ncbi:MAG: hypothetical protein AB1898_11390 [Acidobacteriota bacterium]
MRLNFVCSLALFFVLTGTVQAESFEFRVKHDHTLGGCEGKLITGDREIRYEAADGKHSQRWAYIDIQKLDVASSTRLVLTTFQSQSWKKLERDKVFDFSLVDGKLTPERQEFLRAKLSRPMVARLVEKAEQNPTLLLVRHRHRLGGCEGQLSVEEERLIYLTDRASDNRVWKLREIETLGSPDPYHLRVTTYNETFTFDLKSPLDPKTYDLLWKKIYRLESAQTSKRELLNE